MSSNISYSQINHISSLYSENKVFAIIKVRNKKKWTKEEDMMLIKLAEKNKEKHWKEISKHFTNKNPLQCFSRYKRIKPGIIKGTWSKEEDDKILALVEIYGKTWSNLAKIMRSRNGKQIRDRFINVLDPNVKKGKFSSREDKKIKELYLKYGPRWATISKGLLNRTPDMIKNRFHSSIKKYLHNKHFLKSLKDCEIIKSELGQKNSNSGDMLIINKLRKDDQNAQKNISISNQQNYNPRINIPFENRLYQGIIKNKNCSNAFNDNKYYLNNQFRSVNNEITSRSKLLKENEINQGFNFNKNNFDFNDNNNNCIEKCAAFAANYTSQEIYNIKNCQKAKAHDKSKINIDLEEEFNCKKSKYKARDNEDDMNRTLSNSGQDSEINYENSRLGIKNAQSIENFANYLEYPESYNQENNYINNQANISISTLFENLKNPKDSGACASILVQTEEIRGFTNNDDYLYDNKQSEEHKKQSLANLINFNLNNSIVCKNNYSHNSSLSPNAVNKNNICRKQKLSEKNKMNKLIDKNNFYITDFQERHMSNNKINKINNNSEFIKNSQELKHQNSGTEIEQDLVKSYNKASSKINSYKKALTSPIDENSYEVNNHYEELNYHQENFYDSQNSQKSNQIYSSDHCKSTNNVSCPNVSSSSSNPLSHYENENSLQDILNSTKNSNPYIFNSFEDNYQVNYLNFSQSPYMMKSPKLFDFEDYLINN